MQDQNVGKKCETCNRRDYIPYTCKKCSRILCDDHYWQHPCVKDQYQPSQHVGPDKKRQEYYCSLASCKKKLFTVNHYYCEKCRKLFCLPHRMPEEHQCRKGSHKLAEHQGESCKLI